MNKNNTETELFRFRGGQTTAERLSASLLQIEGFSSVDPQCPLGGPDGLKDVICEQNGWRYIGAAYFPTVAKVFKAIKTKFLADLKGVSKNKADGIIFFTNQHLTPAQRKELEQLAQTKNYKAIVYHLERIRSLLDSPIGFAHRLQFLGISMSTEDQLSFFSQWQTILKSSLRKESLFVIEELSKRLASKGSYRSLEEVLGNLISATQNAVSPIREQPSKKEKISFLQHEYPTKDLTIQSLCFLHRSLMIDNPQINLFSGLRKSQNWIGGAHLKEAIYVPPPPSEVTSLTKKLLSEWKANFDLVVAAGNNIKIEAITKFHHEFLKIHPFLDGNGRIARILLMQQANELFGITRRIVLEDKKPYFDALNMAHQGNLEPLKRVITQTVFGTETV